MRVTRSRIEGELRSLLSKKPEHTKHWHLDYRSLIEASLKLILDENFVKNNIPANIHKCFGLNTAIRKSSLLKAVKDANHFIHGDEHKLEWLQRHSTSLEALVVLLTEFKIIDFDVQNVIDTIDDKDGKDDQQNNELVTPVFKIGTEEIGPWRVKVTEVAPDKNWFKGIRYTAEGEEIQSKYVLADWEIIDSNGKQQPRSNRIFKETVTELSAGSLVSLVFLQVLADNEFAPGHMTLEPDYLMSASELSKASNGSREGSSKQIRQRFLFQKFNSPNPDIFFKGNLVNTIFDSFVSGDSNMSNALRKAWSQDPVSFLFQKEKAEQRFSFETAISEAQGVYQAGIKQALGEIDLNTVTNPITEVEPSFIQPVYGLQGRLDFLRGAFDHEGRAIRCDIIELKSGSYFRGPSESDLDQVGYYDLLLRNIDLENTSPSERMRIKGLRKVLYPKSFGKAETVLHGFNDRNDGHPDTLISFKRTQQLLNARNVIVAMLRNLANQSTIEEFEKLFISYFGFNDSSAFKTQWDVSDFEKIKMGFSNLDDLERQYVLLSISYGLKNNWISALGGKRDHDLGASALWLDKGDTNSRLNRLEGMKLIDFVEIDGFITEVTFERGVDSEIQDNFKLGNQVQIREFDGRKFLQWMVLRGGIVKISRSYITIRLLTPQSLTDSRFRDKESARWTIEDYYYNSTSRIFSSASSFISTPREKKDLLLGIRPPRINGVVEINHNKILQDAINAAELYLVNGVPGAGKTTNVIGGLVEYYVKNNKRVVLLSYTHKSADRICETLEKLQVGGKELSIIRDVASDKVDPRFAYMCVDQRVGEGRKEDSHKFNAWVEQHNVLVGSVLSFKTNSSFAALYEYDCLIIDEASQVLESDLMSILAWSKKTVLVGDMNQLPAISHVDKEQELKVPLLDRVTFTSSSVSYFERMFIHVKQNGWKFAYGELLAQGRMHKEIMDLVNPVFYDDTMVLRDESRQTVLLESSLSARTKFEKILAHSRLLFVDVNAPGYRYSKVNSSEVKWVVQAVEALVSFEQPADIGEFLVEKVGIIVPFRAQRTELRNALETKYDGTELESMLIDTVESFQGSERDNIIISFSVNHEDQLDQITSITHGKDKKLNVALTRAQERLVMFGNAGILAKLPQYFSIIKHCEETGNYMKSGDLAMSFDTPVDVQIDKDLQVELDKILAKLALNEIRSIKCMKENAYANMSSGVIKSRLLNFGSPSVFEFKNLDDVRCKLKLMGSVYSRQATQLLVHSLESHKSSFFEHIYFLGHSAGEVNFALEYFYGKGKESTALVDLSLTDIQTILSTGLIPVVEDIDTAIVHNESLIIIPLYLIGVEFESILKLLKRIGDSGIRIELLILKEEVSSMEGDYDNLLYSIAQISKCEYLGTIKVRLEENHTVFNTINYIINN